jgi:competence protein ComEA
MLRTLVAIAGLLALAGAVPGNLVAQSKSAPRPAAKPPVASAININTAASADLEKLPGIGPKTAERIVEYRQKNGPFKKIEELMNVRGVGEKNFLKLKDMVNVGAAKPERVASQQQ